MILFAHPTSNANVRHAASALADADLLAEFWTCLSWNANSPINRLLPAGVREQLRRRQLPPALLARTRLSPFREIGRHLCHRVGLPGLARHETGPFSIDQVYQALDRRVASRLSDSRGLSCVYCYEDGAAATFAAAKEHGLQRIYELPIGYWRVAQQIYAEEKEREPEWVPTLSGIFDSASKLDRKEQEIRNADVIVVASSFTRDTLQTARVTARRVEVIPYGGPPVSTKPIAAPSSKKLRVLFVGGLSQRKGLSYLLRAIEQFPNDVELTLVGRKPIENCGPLDRAVRKHRWLPSLPHDQILNEMSRHDVLAFPSLFEGFGLVILEAMSRGLPVIATPHTAAPDIVRHGIDGFIVPIRSSEAIAMCLESLLTDPKKLQAMKQAARRTAETFTWADYGNSLVAALKPEVTKTSPHLTGTL